MWSNPFSSRKWNYVKTAPYYWGSTINYLKPWVDMGTSARSWWCLITDSWFLVLTHCYHYERARCAEGLVKPLSWFGWDSWPTDYWPMRRDWALGCLITTNLSQLGRSSHLEGADDCGGTIHLNQMFYSHIYMSFLFSPFILLGFLVLSLFTFKS